MPFNDHQDLQKCDRCANYFSVKRVFNIRPYNPNGKLNEKGFIEQEPVMLCANCRKRIWDWITGESHNFQSVTKGYTKSLDMFEGFGSNDG